MAAPQPVSFKAEYDAALAAAGAAVARQRAALVAYLRRIDAASDIAAMRALARNLPVALRRENLIDTDVASLCYTNGILQVAETSDATLLDVGRDAVPPSLEAGARRAVAMAIRQGDHAADITPQPTLIVIAGTDSSPAI